MINRPIGSIYITENNLNPSVYFEGTWEKISLGQTLARTDSKVFLGRGSIVDKNDTFLNFILNETGGNSNISLTVDQLPNHTHNYNTTKGIGSYNSATHSGTTNTTTTKSVTFDPTGGSQPFSLMQPYCVVNIWQRTA